MTDLERLKKSNQAYKLRLAQKAGFTSVEEYKTFLTTPKTAATDIRKVRKTRRVTPVVSVKPEKKVTIHVVDILDASGSMSGGKFNNSKVGIQDGVADLRRNKDANFTYTLIEFVDKRSVLTPYFMADLPTFIEFCHASGGDTPLYHTVYQSLLKLEKFVKKREKVLVKIYTDGGDNSMPGFMKPARDIIARLQKENFTITFVATDSDMGRIQRDLSLDASNTLTVKNDAEGFREAFQQSMGATRSYAAGASAGKDVSLGFYKKVGTL